jgi:hypothetical protein
MTELTDILPFIIFNVQKFVGFRVKADGRIHKVLERNTVLTKNSDAGSISHLWRELQLGSSPKTVEASMDGIELLIEKTMTYFTLLLLLISTVNK